MSVNLVGFESIPYLVGNQQTRLRQAGYGLLHLVRRATPVKTENHCMRRIGIVVGWDVDEKGAGPYRLVGVVVGIEGPGRVGATSSGQRGQNDSRRHQCQEEEYALGEH